MARKPVHLQAAGPRQDRQAMWEVMRRLKAFSARAIRGELRGAANLATIRSYLTGLEKAGYLEPVGEGPRRYRLVRDCGVDAPRVRKDGSEVTQGGGQESLWRAMKALGEFSAQDLVLMCPEEQPVKLETAKDYCGWLHRAGYLQQTARPNPRGGLARYRLIPSRYTGPRPPMIQRVKQVFDPNRGEVVYRQGDRDHG